MTQVFAVPVRNSAIGSAEFERKAKGAVKDPVRARFEGSRQLDEFALRLKHKMPGLEAYANGEPVLRPLLANGGRG